MKKVADALISERKYDGILTGNPTANLVSERPSRINMLHVASNVLSEYRAKLTGARRASRQDVARVAVSRGRHPNRRLHSADGSAHHDDERSDSDDICCSPTAPFLVSFADAPSQTPLASFLMQTFHYDAQGYSVNDVADCWRHMFRAPCFTTVFIHGVEGWTGSTTFYAVTDDFGDLILVRQA